MHKEQQKLRLLMEPVFFISVLEHSVIRLAMLFAWHSRMKLLLLLWLGLTAVARQPASLWLTVF